MLEIAIQHLLLNNFLIDFDGRVLVINVELDCLVTYVCNTRNFNCCTL